MKSVITILIVVSLGLGAALLVQHKKAEDQVRAAKAEAISAVKERDIVRAKLDDHEKVIARLEANFTQRGDELAAKNAELTRTGADLQKTSADLAKSQADYKLARTELEKQTVRIGELETQRDDLTAKMSDLTASINAKENLIADIKKKLAASEGDRQFLLGQLKQLEGEKAELVAQFNNLSTLRAQIAKLKEEAAVNQRLAWMRMGLYQNRDRKGAEALVVSSPNKNRPADNRLQIELEQNGPGKVVPPKSAPAN